MASFSTLLLTIFMVMFWMFRAIVALCTQFSIDLIGIVSYDFNMEVIIAFATLICIILVTKRKIIGALLYLMLYGVYFGEHFITNGIILIQGQDSVDIALMMNLIADFTAILLAIFVLIDMLLDKGRKASTIDKKTDWYFKNEKYDEELKARDQREDKNEYKFY